MEKREHHMRDDHPLQVLLGNLRVVDRERLHLEKAIRRYHGACSELRQNPYLHPDVREFLQEYVDRYDGLWGSRGAETRTPTLSGVCAATSGSVRRSVRGFWPRPAPERSAAALSPP